jgi:hypothetical protein
MGPAMLDNVLASMATQDAVLATAVQAIASAASADFGAAAAAITGNAADATFAALLNDGLVELKSPAWAVF